MPVYEYECKDCAKIFEVQQRMADKPLAVCPECQGEVKKLVSMSSFQLKGSGWYADGYASASAAGAAKKSPAEAAPACPSGGSCAGCPAAAASAS